MLLLSKVDSWSEQAGALAQAKFGERLVWLRGRAGDAMPSEFSSASADWLISFLSPWIVPADVLANVGRAINFHPASSHYPGIGCYNFCLYEGSQQYGVVSHYMEPKVDTGRIIEERLFDVRSDDSVETLKLRTMEVMSSMYADILNLIASGKPLPESGARWTRKPFTRKQLNELTVIKPDMSGEEIRRRVRATTYPGFPGASVELGGVVFSAAVPNRKPLA